MQRWFGSYRKSCLRRLAFFSLLVPPLIRSSFLRFETISSLGNHKHLVVPTIAHVLLRSPRRGREKICGSRPLHRFHTLHIKVLASSLGTTLSTTSPPYRVVCPYLRGSFRSPPSAASTSKKPQNSSNHSPPSANLSQLPPGVLDLLHSAATCAQMLVDGRCESTFDPQLATNTNASLQSVPTRNWNEFFQ